MTTFGHLVFLQEPRRPTPSVVARCSAAEMVFDEDNVELETLADGVSVSRPKDVFSALSSVLAMHWVFDIAYGPGICRKLCLQIRTEQAERGRSASAKYVVFVDSEKREDVWTCMS